MPSIDAQELDGPRPVRQAEWAAVRRLDALCFPGFVDEAEEPPLRFGGAGGGSARHTSPRHEDIEVLCYRGMPISKIGIYYNQVNMCGSPLRIASIGGVCTHPDYEGQGLATRLLDHCARKATGLGARLMLISGMRGLYTRAGYVTAQDYEHVVLKPGQLCPTIRCCPAIRCSALPSLRPATEADASSCAHLYQMEPVHFMRRVEKFTRHFHWRERFPQAEDWIVEVGGRPAAYIFSGIPWECWPATCASIREVVEYAGSRVALASGLARVIAQPELREMRLFVPWQDVDFLQLLRGQDAAGEHVPLPGHTMRIVNFPGLMSDLRPYVRARLTESQRRGLRFEQEKGPALSGSAGDCYAIVRGRERVELDGTAMTRLVMGNLERMANGEWRMAIGSGVLAEIVPALFPLPAFLPGLNFQ